MGNSCQRILEEDSDCESERERAHRSSRSKPFSLSSYWSEDSDKRRSLKGKILSPFSPSLRSSPSSSSSSSSGRNRIMNTFTLSKNSNSSSGNNRKEVSKLGESPRRMETASYAETLQEEERRLSASLSSASATPRRSPFRLMDMPREEVNRESDDFIRKMRCQMAIERQVSELEYLQRLQRSAA